MMKLAKGFIVSAMLATTACVPMEQASLTYTSKTTMGVGVAAGTQDTPGLEVTIGFKETNIALVPVAVAKYCYKASKAQCQNAIYQMRMIQGGRSDKVDNRALESRIREISGKIEDLVGRQKLDGENLVATNADIKKFETADSANKELVKFNKDNPVEGESADVANQRAALAAKANVPLPQGFNIATARAEAAALESAITVSGTTIATNEQLKAQLTGQLERNSNSGRQDSYSVYGKFNGNATGNKDGAGLTVGKVFATGIAAQNLTEYATAADCLSNIRALADMMPVGDKRTDFLATAGNICGRTK